MICGYDKQFEGVSLRSHPWTHAQDNLNEKYYDFRTHPELISIALEDFTTWNSYQATQTFYDLLKWVNSNESQLESNDCAFGSVIENTDPNCSKTLTCKGRLMILYRQLELNVNRENVQMLNDGLLYQLNKQELGFKLGAVSTTIVPTKYLALKQIGTQVLISLYAWGDDQDETMNNLDRVFRALFESLKSVSHDIELANLKA